MRIVVSDANCLCDLRKASMLDSAFGLPHEFLMANTVFELELLNFTAPEKKALIRSGLKIVDLPGERIVRAQVMLRQFPQLSVHDGLTLALAEMQPKGILLSNEDSMRVPATSCSIKVHGILWLLEELHRHRLTSVASTLDVLRTFSEDVTVRLPRRELAAYIRKYEGLS